MAGPVGSKHASQDDLSAYAVDANLVASDIAQHIAACPDCSAEVESYQLLEASLYRFECPDLEELEAYIQGRLTPQQMATVESHRLECPLCEHDLAVIRAVRPVVAAPSYGPVTDRGEAGESMWERIQGSVRRVVAQLLPAPPELGLAVRSKYEPGNTGDERTAEIYTAGTIEVALRWRQGPEGTTLSGQIAGVEDAIAARLVKSGIVGAHEAPEQVETPAPLETPIPAGGFFTIGPVLPGSYTLEVLMGDELIEITNLQL
jgi:hypothetical protein